MNALERRYEITLNFLEKHVRKDEKILDLGTTNPLSDFLRSKGFKIINTTGQDLDIDFKVVIDYKVITAFEIFEHMFAPFNLLNESKGKLIASVPLRLWFAQSYWSEDDKLNCHYHEFEIRQFNHLLDRTGWKIIDSKTIKSYDMLFGIRPLLRRFYPRYYFVFAEK
jgi:hypothetical protein